ncbi:TsaC protein (YrdC domain) required for threonylcarbamoyladenosine t(6)A37 modification in tRNA [hydrothermal vent metagenome]|uniref:TsaC protein (YrdC domain) required for threonylcarbamoyladenosine t(6)A37 modification in tRNA n=1 Tax=hydrothermal vent metagenome TaxID=652676 RepID=A0A1W1EHP7_9ZZZZ
MLHNLIFLSQTDTTIGFVSQDDRRLSKVKKRLPNKSYIKAISSLKILKSYTRVPNIHKNRVRRAKRTTFIINSNSYRVIKNSKHNLLLDRLGWAYTTSANLSGDNYSDEFAKSSCDVEVSFDKKSDKIASKIYKINNSMIFRIR